MARTPKADVQLTTAQRLGSVVKSARDIMRKDKGLNGDLDRLPMLTPYSRKPCPVGRGEWNPLRGIINGAGGPLYPAPWLPCGFMTESPGDLAYE